MEDNEKLVAEVSERLLESLNVNNHRGTIQERNVVGALGHVNKAMFRLLQRDQGREADMRECIDAIAYLSLVYAIRKNPYGEF